NGFVRFSLIRQHFEEFLVAHKDHIQQVHRNARGQTKGVDAIREYVSFLIDELSSYTGNSPLLHLQTKLSKSKFSFLSTPKEKQGKVSSKRTFPPAMSNSAFIAQKLKEAT